MNMKKAFLIKMLGVLLAISLMGCGDSNVDNTVQESIDNQTSMESISEEKIEEIQESSAAVETDTSVKADTTIKENLWEDNTKDAYMGIVKNVFDLPQPEDLKGGSEIAIGGCEKGVLFGKYFFEEYKNNRECLYVGLPDGTYEEIELKPEDYDLQGAVLMAGPSACSDEFILYISTRKDDKYIDSFAVIDDKGNCIRTLQPDSSIDLHVYAPECMMMDVNGNIYFRTTTEGGLHYLVLDAEGKPLLEKYNTGYGDIRFVPMANGEVAFLATTTKDTYQLIGVDLETGEESVLVDLFKLQENEKDNPDMLYATMTDEKVIYYVNSDGIYRCSRNEETEELYLFRNHGIKVNEVYFMKVSEDNHISMMYDGGTSAEFLLLKPTDEQKEIIEIPFVMTEANQISYADIIVDFNKKYPQYLITETIYEDETQLLTQLTAGKGPVLVDTGLLDFESNVKLWECLDEALSAEELDALLDKVKDAGKIDGKQYGIVTEWTMFTFAGYIEGLTDWNYEECMEYLKAHPQIQYAFQHQTPLSFINLFFMQGIDDSIFWNAKEDEAFLESDRFVWLLELAGKMAKEEDTKNRSEMIEEVRSGKRLGELIYINGPESFTYYDTILGESVQYIGFPGNDGSKHYLSTVAPITVRATASEEEKEGAILFLKYLISYEAQKSSWNAVRSLSVRKDVLEESLEEINDYAYFSVDGENFEISVDKVDVKKRFTDLYEKSEVWPNLPNEVRMILEEETGSYFNGQKSAKQVSEIIQNRIQLYFYEH